MICFDLIEWHTGIPSSSFLINSVIFVKIFYCSLFFDAGEYLCCIAKKVGGLEMQP